MTALRRIGCVPARVISTFASGGGSGRYRFCLFCVVSGLCLHSRLLLKAMKFDTISARVDNDGTNMVKRIKIEHRNDRRNCRLYPSGLLIDGTVLYSLLPVALHIYL